MSTTIKLIINTEIPGLSDEIEIEPIRRELIDHLSDITPRINLDHLDDWSLLISINLRSTNGIGIFKRSCRYPTDKEFQVSISIAVPNDIEATYGLSNVRRGFFHPLNNRKFHILGTAFDRYATLPGYILASASMAIDEGFRQGFTCNGKRIRLQHQDG